MVAANLRADAQLVVLTPHSTPLQLQNTPGTPTRDRSSAPQLRVLRRSGGKRPRLRNTDRILWVWLSRLWSGWRRSLVIVRPKAVIAWHRKGFRLYWRWKSRPRRPGRPALHKEVRDLLSVLAHSSRPGKGIIQCAVKRRRFSVGAKPIRQLSLQPVAIGAVEEATNLLKPSV